MKSKNDFENEGLYFEYLRNYYAGLAMSGIMSNPTYTDRLIKLDENGGGFDMSVSIDAINVANKMVSTLQKMDIKAPEQSLPNILKDEKH